MRVCGTRSVLADDVGLARSLTTSLQYSASFEVDADENDAVVVVVVVVAAAAVSAVIKAFLRRWLRLTSCFNNCSSRNKQKIRPVESKSRYGRQ